MVESDPIRFYSFMERMGHLCTISDKKAKKDTADQGLQSTGFRSNLARETIPTRSWRHFIRPRRHFVNNEKTIYLRNICWFGRM